MDRRRPNRSDYPLRTQRSVEFSRRRYEEWRSEEKENSGNRGNRTPERVMTDECLPVRNDTSRVKARTRLFELDPDSPGEDGQTAYKMTEKPVKSPQIANSAEFSHRNTLTVMEFKEQSRAIQRELHRSIPSPIRTVSSEKPVRSSAAISGSQHYSDLEVISRSRREALLLDKIAKYEERIRQQSSAIAALHSQVNVRTLSVQKLEKELSQCIPEKHSREILLKVRETLGVSNSQNVVAAVRKLERKSKDCTEAERWLHCISAVVCPDSMQTSGDRILSEVKQWETELNDYRKRSGEHANLLQFFKNTLKCTESSELKSAISTLYAEHHDLRSFVRQLKAALGQREDCPLPVLLQTLKQRLPTTPRF